MRTPPALASCLLLVALAGALPAAASADGPVTVYRCVDSRGQVTLADAPCEGAAQQQVRQMQRPQDAPAAQATAVASPVPLAPAPATAPPAHLAFVRPPQPMYECVTPDGDRYDSETGDGNPRWVPLWTLGYRGGHGHGGRPAAGQATRALNAYQGSRPLGGHVGAPAARATGPGPAEPPRPPRPGHPHRPGYGDIGGAGTWVQDSCRALPQSEVCARLVDRRDAIRTRFFNAQEQERNRLRGEERGINARLDADCGRS